jgi:hypothetical protein
MQKNGVMYIVIYNDCYQSVCLFGDYPSSSVHTHLSGFDESGLVEVNKVQEIFGDWKNHLLNAQGLLMVKIEFHNRTVRPLGNKRFLKMAEKITGKDLVKKKPRPKSKKIN